MTSDLNMIEFQKEFLTEARFLIEQCEESFLGLERDIDRDSELAKIYRVIHTFKGAGAAVGFADIAEFTHIVEDALSTLRTSSYLLTADIITTLLKVGDALKKRINYLDTGERDLWEIRELMQEVQQVRDSLKVRSETEKPPMSPSLNIPSTPIKQQRQIGALTSGQTATVKVDTERIESVLDAVGELVVIKSQLMNELHFSTDQSSKLGGIVSLLDRTIRDLQDRALSMRMTPLKSTFLKLQRVVRDLSVKLSKPVEFQMEGEDVEMDRTMVEVMADPLMHIIRNSLDHGIEKMPERLAKGKPEKGLIQLKAKVLGSRVLIQIKDDGGGIPRDRIIKKAIERGLLTSLSDAETLTDNQVYQFIFAAGFSTAEKVTDVSGRGVGMDVVKTNIEKLRGTVQIESILNQGTSLTVSLPLTTSITDGLLVNIHNHPYVLPIDCILELVDIRHAKIFEMRDQGTVLNLRGKIFPLIDLREIFARSHNALANQSAIVIIEIQGNAKAILVDQVFEQTQVVQKPLREYLVPERAGLCGAAILGDGRVALVLDVDLLIRNEVVA